MLNNISKDNTEKGYHSFGNFHTKDKASLQTYKHFDYTEQPKSMHNY